MNSTAQPTKQEPTKQEPVEQDNPPFIPISLPIADKMAIGTVLANDNQLFRTFWDMADVILTTRIETACVSWNEEQTTIDLSINPLFWSVLNDDDRKFLVIHEMMHIFLNHHKRFYGKDKKLTAEEAKLINIATDIAINEWIVKYYIPRSLLSDAIGKQGCFVDTVFKDDPKMHLIPREESADWYLEKLKKDKPKIQTQCLGKDGKPDPSTANGPADGTVVVVLNDNGTLGTADNSTADVVIKEITKLGAPQIVQSGPPDDPTYDAVAPAMPQNGEDEKKQKIICVDAGKGGTNPLGVWRMKKTPKKIWEKFIKKWMFNKPGIEEEEIETWSAFNRRTHTVSRLPGDRPEEKLVFKGKMECWVFLDFSGSCASISDRIMKVCATIPQEKFKIRYFPFADYSVEVFPKKASDGTYSFVIPRNAVGHGTDIDGIISVIQKNTDNMKPEQFPKCIFCLTDGQFGYSHIQLPFPERWHFVLTAGVRGISSFINPCHKHTFAEVEKG